MTVPRANPGGWRRWGWSREAGRVAPAGIPSFAQPPRLARHLARAPPPGPPSPETGVAHRSACGGDGSRGGGALRFGARYGSSDSLPTAPACRASQSVERVGGILDEGLLAGDGGSAHGGLAGGRGAGAE